MTAPEERPDRPDEPDDDQTWAELVRSFHATPDAGEPSWPAAEDLDPGDAPPEPETFPAYTDDLAGRAGLDGLSSPGSGRSADSADDPGGDGALPSPRSAADDSPDSLDPDADHFVPPQPPPIPRGDRISRLAWAGVLVPPIVILVAGVTSMTVPTGFMAFLALAFIAGFGTLISRLRGHHPSDPDDGAVL